MVSVSGIVGQHVTLLFQVRIQKLIRKWNLKTKFVYWTYIVMLHCGFIMASLLGSITYALYFELASSFPIWFINYKPIIGLIQQCQDSLISWHFLNDIFWTVNRLKSVISRIFELSWRNQNLEGSDCRLYNVELQKSFMTYSSYPLAFRGTWNVKIIVSLLSNEDDLLKCYE